MPVVVVIGGVAIDVVSALAILLVAYACALLLVQPLAWLIGHIPVIGQQIANALTSGVGSFMAWAQDNAKNTIGAIVGIVSAPVYWLQTSIAYTVQVAENTVAQLVAAIQNIAAVSYRVGLATANIVGEIVALSSRLASTITSIPTIAHTVASSLVAAAEARLRDMIASVSTAYRAADAVLSSLIAQRVAELAAAIHATDAGIRALLTTTVATLRQEWATDLKPVQQAIDQALPVTEAITSLGIIPLAIATSQELTKVMDECITPNCNALSPSLDILNALIDGTMLAEMLALVAAAQQDPEGTARTVIGIVDGVEGIASGILAPAGIRR
jgi:hypothetical protein